MTAFLEILSPGTHTTVQDLGRRGYLDAGVPPSGALDPLSLRLANLLVGNDPAAAGLESFHLGPELRVQADSLRVALVGAEIEILEPEAALHRQWQSLTLARGARFRVTPLRDRATAYLAVAGGFALQPCLGSLSTYVRGGFGGLHGRALAKGDRVALVEQAAGRTPDLMLPKPPTWTSSASSRIRVVLGPQQDHFTDDGLAALCGGPFTISPRSDRMGARLEGPAIALRSHEGFISDGIVAGAIQVPGSGQAIILLADHQTTGGYPKIATVISADLPLLGRLRPGSELTFEAVDVATAEAERRRQEADMAALAATICAAPAAIGIDLDRLHRENLVSGVVSSTEEP